MKIYLKNFSKPLDTLQDKKVKFSISILSEIETIF